MAGLPRRKGGEQPGPDGRLSLSNHRSGGGHWHRSPRARGAAGARCLLRVACGTPRASVRGGSPQLLGSTRHKLHACHAAGMIRGHAPLPQPTGLGAGVLGSWFSFLAVRGFDCNGFPARGARWVVATQEGAFRCLVQHIAAHEPDGSCPRPRHGARRPRPRPSRSGAALRTVCRSAGQPPRASSSLPPPRSAVLERRSGSGCDRGKRRRSHRAARRRLG